MINRLERYSFSYILQSALNKVPNTIDKREGSIIYDALAPACYQLADYYMELINLLNETFIITATGDNIDKRVLEQGIERLQPTNAIRRGIFRDINGDLTDDVVQIGHRFSAVFPPSNAVVRPSETFIVVGHYYDLNGNRVTGHYQLMSEQLGTIGNSFKGNLVPLSNIGHLLLYSYLDLIISPARDIETDDQLRERFLLAVRQKPFGGNVSQYRLGLRELSDPDFPDRYLSVGEVQVYPVWNGGGTVKLSVVDSEYNPISLEIQNKLSSIIDPENNFGERGTGIGFAPIGHKVTVTTPIKKIVDIETTLVLNSGYTIGQIRPLVEEAIENYFVELRKEWGIPDRYYNYRLGVFLARINHAILSIRGVANAINTKINGYSEDITLIQNSTIQELPFKGDIILNVY